MLTCYRKCLLINLVELRKKCVNFIKNSLWVLDTLWQYEFSEIQLNNIRRVIRLFLRGNELFFYYYYFSIRIIWITGLFEKNELTYTVQSFSFCHQSTSSDVVQERKPSHFRTFCKNRTIHKIIFYWTVENACYIYSLVISHETGFQHLESVNENFI